VHADMALVPALPSRDAVRSADRRWLECAAARIPTIVSEIAVAKDSKTSAAHGKTAWCVVDSPAAWLEAIAHLAADHRLRDRIAASAAQVVSERRSSRTCAKRWLELYRTLQPASRR